MNLQLTLSFASMAALVAFAEKNKDDGSIIESDIAKQNHEAANSIISEENDLNNSQPVNGLDADGLPWDERIHSSNKKTKADGRWTKRKNVDEAIYNNVLAELRARFPQTAVNQIPAPVMPNYVAAPQPLPSIGNLPPVQSFTPPPPALPAYAPVAAPTQGAYDMGHLFQRIQQIFAVGDATANSQYVTTVINRLSQMFNVAIGSINDIGNRPDIITQAHALLTQDGKQ